MLAQVKDDRLHFNHNLTTGVVGGGREALPQLSLYCLAFPRTPSVMCRRMCVSEGQSSNDKSIMWLHNLCTGSCHMQLSPQLVECWSE